MSQLRVISFCGLSGSGKTTLMKELALEFERLHHSVYSGYYLGEGLGNSSVSRYANKIGFKINENTTFDTQYFISLKYMEADVATRKIAITNDIKNIIYDRSTLDPIPYTMASKNIPLQYKRSIKEMLYSHIRKFPINHMFYIEPLNSIESDGLRPVDSDFNANILNEYSEVLDDMNSLLGLRLVIIPNDTVKNRVKMITDSLFSKISDKP